MLGYEHDTSRHESDDTTGGDGLSGVELYCTNFRVQIHSLGGTNNTN